MFVTCRECGAGGGHMDDLIGRLVAYSGADRTAADNAVGIIQFTCGTAGEDAVGGLVGAIPGLGPFV